MEEKDKERSTITSVAEKELDLLSRHLQVMATVKEHGPIGIIKLSQMTGQPQHMIRYSLRTLEKDGIIEPSPHGAIITDKIYMHNMHILLFSDRIALNIGLCASKYKFTWSCRCILVPGILLFMRCS